MGICDQCNEGLSKKSNQNLFLFYIYFQRPMSHSNYMSNILHLIKLKMQISKLDK